MVGFATFIAEDELAMDSCDLRFAVSALALLRSAPNSSKLRSCSSSFSDMAPVNFF